MNKNLHKYHRQRVRDRYIREGSLEHFEDHQILEFLLFYAVPMKDTNELAHKIINEFGNINNLFNTRPEEIQKRCKISENMAVLISLVPHLARRYLTSSNPEKNEELNTFLKASKYFYSLLAGQPNESFYMLCLDINKKLKNSVKISDGSHDRAFIYIEKVVSDALLYNSSFVLIGHNHPAGTLKPSSDDMSATQKIVSALEPVGIKVLDHIIICGKENYSFAKNNLCCLKY